MVQHTMLLGVSNLEYLNFFSRDKGPFTLPSDPIKIAFLIDKLDIFEEIKMIRFGGSIYIFI